jgi:sugar phosphate isomerase/epimerase
VTQPGIPNAFVLSTACFGARLKTIEDQAFAAVAMGFRNLELGLSDQPVPLNGWEDSHRETGVRVLSVVAGALNPRSENTSGCRLGSNDPEQRERSLNSMRRHIRLAQHLKAPVVVVRGCEVEDPRLATEAAELKGELMRANSSEAEAIREKIRTFAQRVVKKGQRQLEHFCRALHTLARDFPETVLAIEPGRQINDLLSFDAVGWALDDLSKQGVAYWHDTGRIHERACAGLPDQGAWLDAYSSRMCGIHLHDASDEDTDLPPGLGEVDFRLVSEYVPRTAARVLEVDPRHGRPELLAAVQFLIDAGF